MSLLCGHSSCVRGLCMNGNSVIRVVLSSHSHKHRPLQIFPNEARSYNRIFHLQHRNVRTHASKWADRLFSDFEVPNPSTATVAVVPPERKFTLPIDFYQVLGAETHFLGDGIRRAYEAVVRRVPHESYSEEALRGRISILQVACETLANPRSRGDYNQGLIEDEAGTMMRDVPWDKVPGALCLLQEIGEAEVVIQAGRKLLQESIPKSFKRDVILAMALAYVDVSREAMAEAKPDIIKSCEALERALHLLQEGGGKGLALDLQVQIDDTLEEITPRYVLDILALPLDEKHRIRREEGLQRVRSILWAVGGGGAVAAIPGFSREEFMKEAFMCMTAAEQVDLFTATPSNIPADGSEVRAAALAHVAEGFVGKKPNLIQEADNLFLQLQKTEGISIETGDDSPSEQDQVLALERGMCALLLGDLSGCRHWLGMNSINSSYRNPSVIDFIHQNSNEDVDQLSGLCKLLESWLAEVVFINFRDTKNLGFRLRDYYDHPSVLSFLERLEKVKGSPLAAATAIAKLGAGAGAAIDTVKESAILAFKKVFPLATGGAGKEKATYDTSNIIEEVPYTGTSSPSNDYIGIDAIIQSKLGDRDPAEVVPDYASDSTDVYVNNSNVLASKESSVRSRNRFSGTKIAFTGVVIGALAFAVLKYSRGHQATIKPSTQLSSSSAAAISSTNDCLEQSELKMDARLAENLVRQWQLIKSQALGPSHEVSQLPEILDGEMLKIWSERAKEIAEHGWVWEYSLLGLNIDSVTISRDGRRAMVEVTLQEAARLIDNDHPEHNDSYRSTYTTRYELMNANGSWKITDGAVLRS